MTAEEESARHSNPGPRDQADQVGLAAETHPFSADRPITSRAEDLLGRVTFAESLAKAIEGWRQKDSLVIALYGDWGSGKTSVKNMVVETLEHGGRTRVVEFNPWQWSAQEQVAQAFFAQIGIALGLADRTKEGKERAAKWQRYAEGLNILAPVPAVGVLGRIGHAVGAFFAKRAEATIPDLRQRKSELRKSLSELAQPLLVVIDDVDRLSANEMRLLVQLVKANADFPNLVYLLLFEREIVEKALETEPGVSGRDYLEKIVQVGFDIPQVERTRLEKVLFARLDELLRIPGVESRWNKQRWARLFVDGLRPFFESLRDVRRFAATLEFHVSLLHRDETLEVNPIDLVGLEALRLFEPWVYRALPAAKQELTEVAPSLAGSAFGRDDARQEARRALLRSVVDLAEPARRTAVEAILKELFPTAKWAFGEPAYATMEDAWLRDLRVCRPEVFDRYFLLAVAERDISQPELDALLAAAGDRRALVGRLRTLRELGLLEVAVDRLMAYRDELDLAQAGPFITALFDVGDDLPHEAGGLLALSPLERAPFLVRDYLAREPDKRARAEALRQAVQATDGLLLPVLTIAREGGRGSGSDPESAPLEEEDLRDLEGLCLEKIREAATSGRLGRGPRLLSFLHQWERWSPGEPAEWVGDMIRSKDGLLAFLRGSLSRILSQTAGDYLLEERYVIRLEEIEPFVSVEEVSSALERLGGDDLGPDDRQAVEAFRRALQRRAEDRSDEDWDDL